MRKTISALSFLLSLLMVFLIFSGCGQAGSDGHETEGRSDGSQSSTETEKELDTRIQPSLPERTFNGEEIHCLHWTLGEGGPGENGWIPWEEIAIDTMTGDVVGDAVYERNHYVEEKYKVLITTEYAVSNTELPNKVKLAYNTGDDDFDFIVQRSNDISSLWTNEYFYNLRGDDTPYLDLEKPWWNQDSLKAFTFGNVTQFASSELLVLDKSETGVVFFSTVLRDNLGLDNFYDLVTDGQWTWEALIRNAEICENDLDGDLIMTAADQYGTCGNRTVGSFMFVGAGRKFADINSTGHFFTEVGSEDSIDLMAEIHETVIYESFHALSDRIEDFRLTNKFMDNQIGFLFYSVKLANTLRNMETNYGILPIPKYDEYQPRYYDLISAHGDSLLAIPVSNRTPEITSFVLEAMTAESYYTVYPAFFDVVMMGRCTREPESRDMLEIIFKSRTYDVGLIHGLGGYTAEYEQYAQLHYGDVGFTSLYWKYQDIIDKAVTRINELIDEWN